MRLIDAGEVQKIIDHIRGKYVDSYGRRNKVSQFFWDTIRYIEKKVRSLPTVDAVPLSEIYRVIAGHSNYHGDSILAALTCISEGKKVEPIKPVDAVPVVHGEWIKGDSGEWQCSECREENCYAYDENLKKFTDLYCPNCGVKMDGKKVQE